jgi:hypothetical protein
VLKEPLDPIAAKALIKSILKNGEVTFSEHALEEMAKDELTTVDCVNVLRAGVVEAPEFERGSWRYRTRTNRIYVVAAFRSEQHLKIVTAWRI